MAQMCAVWRGISLHQHDTMLPENPHTTLSLFYLFYARVVDAATLNQDASLKALSLSLSLFSIGIQVLDPISSITCWINVPQKIGGVPWLVTLLTWLWLIHFWVETLMCMCEAHLFCTNKTNMFCDFVCDLWFVNFILFYFLLSFLSSVSIMK